MSPAPTPVARAVTPADVGAVAVVEAACFDDAWSLALLQTELEAPGRVLLVTGEPVSGWVAVAVVAETADLLRIAIVPAARRTGLGRRLLDDALAAAGQAGAERMLLEVADANTAARRLYAGAGFREIHRRRDYYGRGADALVLERPLP